MPGLNRSLRGVLVFGLLGAVSQTAHANPVVYNDALSYQAATTGLSNVNFNGIAPTNGFVDYGIPPGYTDAGTGTNFTFLNANGSDINVTSATYYSFNFGGPVFPADVLNSSSTVPIGASESITLPATETAVSLYFSTYDGAPITITLSNGDSYVDSASPGFGNFAFLGFTDTTGFSSLTVTDPTDSGVLLADFTFGTAIPEPSALAVLGTALLLLAGYRHRRDMGDAAG
jgi:hypothetical protein